MNENIPQGKERYVPLITLSVVSHGDAEKVYSLLESVGNFEQTELIQVIATDNLGHEIGKIEETPWSSIDIIQNEKILSFARNHNRAFKLARGKYFCVLNPDVLFEQKVFPPLINLLEREHADIVAPLVVDAKAMPQDSFRNFPTPIEIIRRRLPGYRFSPPLGGANGLVQPDWISGLFMLMRSETYRELNGFDEKFHLYFEDVDFCARARLAGLKLLVDTNQRIQHNAHHASRKELMYLFWHTRSAMQFFISPVYKKIRNLQS
ncbi:MAG: glycosyltransferase [Anaerolineales bacterium]|jgi:GT2 family glycosyltransferase